MNLKQLFFIMVLITAVLVSLPASAILRETKAEETAYVSNIIYGFRVNLAKIGITPRYVSVLDETRVLIVGSLGNVNGVVVLNVINPYDDPVIEDIYPLTGTPTYVASDGYPATRLAIGSDKGEILLLRINAGRITKHLYVVLGADFYVNKLILAKDVLGVKVITLVSEGGPRGYPCMNCYVYVLDEEARGILRIGPKVGNATATCPGLEGINVQDVVPLAIYGSSEYYWDSSNVAVTYIPPVIKLLFNVTYINETTGEYTPLPGTLVEVSLEYNETGNRIVYGVNVDADGVARVPIPRETANVLLINLTIRNIGGAEIWRYSYTYDPKAFTEIPDEILLPSAVLTTMNVDSRPATKIYGVPPFLNVALDLVDLTLAPMSCERKAAATFFIKPSVRDLALLKGEADDRVKIMYTEPDEGFLTISIAKVNVTSIEQITRVTDYVGVNTLISSSGVFSDGRYLIAGLSDGRLRMYIAQSESYRLKDIYTMGSSLYDLIMIPGIEGYTYVAVSSRGIQVLRIDPYPIPIYRNIASLYLTTPGFIHGDALADLSTIVLVDPHEMIIIKNSNLAVANRLILTADRIMARDVELIINTPGGEDINGSTVTLMYPGGSSEYKLFGNNLTIRNILPGVTYNVSIIPSVNYIHNASFSLILKDSLSLEITDVRNAAVYSDKCCRVFINTTYISYSVNLRISDEFSGPSLMAPIDIYIDNEPVVVEGRENMYSFRLIYGQHTITVQPSKGYENTYQPYAITLTIDKDVEIPVLMERAKYPVSIKVADIYGTIISPLDLSISGPVNIDKTIEQPETTISVLLPYGDYTLSITPHNASIYLPYTTTFSVKAPQTLALTVQRVKYKVELTVTSKFSIIGKFDLYANGTKVASNIEKQAVVELPYGSYSLRLVPMAGWEDVYEPSRPVNITVTSDTSITIPVNRKSYTLRVVTLEQGKPIINVAVHIYNVETGELMTALTTDENGVAQTSLPYGIYRLEISHEQYNREVIVIPLDKELSEVVSLRPTPVTLLWRFMPIIGALIGIGVAVYVAMKIRAIIARRLVTEEAF
ncbi:MAG: carboxypeptidase-like regulatory domain-containing protein [Desulfurococcaceae archaeon]